MNNKNWTASELSIPIQKMTGEKNATRMIACVGAKRFQQYLEEIGVYVINNNNVPTLSARTIDKEFSEGKIIHLIEYLKKKTR